jgi:hypothetical protein
MFRNSQVQTSLLVIEQRPKAAGYGFSGKPRNYAQNAYKVFKKPLVRAYLQEIQEKGKTKAIEAVQITEERALHELEAMQIAGKSQGRRFSALPKAPEMPCVARDCLHGPKVPLQEPPSLNRLETYLRVQNLEGSFH